MSDCCLASTQQFVSYIMVRTVAFKWTDDEICFFVRQGCLARLAHWNNNPQVDMSPPLGHIIQIPSPCASLCSFLHNVACLSEKQQIPIL